MRSRPSAAERTPDLHVGHSLGVKVEKTSVSRPYCFGDRLQPPRDGGENSLWLRLSYTLPSIRVVAPDELGLRSGGRVDLRHEAGVGAPT